MKISPNYQIKMFNSKINKQQTQTNPSFGMAKKVITTTLPLVAAGTFLAVQNGIVKLDESSTIKQDLPTEEEFNAKLKECEDEFIGHSNYYIHSFKRQYKKNPEKAVQEFMAFKEIMQLKNDNGMDFCNSPENAMHIAEKREKFPTAFNTMFNLKDSWGNPRFSIKDYFADDGEMQLIEKKPELFIKYAQLNNDNGYPRFTFYDLISIAKLNIEKEVSVEDIDAAVNMRKNDGTYVFKQAPYDRNINCMKEYPKEFTELVNLQIPAYWQYIHLSPYDINVDLIEIYKENPETMKKLLSLPNKNGNDQRFETREVIHNKSIIEYFEKCPKTFMALANIPRVSDMSYYRFNFKDITELAFYFGRNPEDGSCHEIDAETLNYIAKVANMENTSCTIKPKEMYGAYEAYKKYPKETLEILSNYSFYDGYRDAAYAPTIEDVELYINDRDAFDADFDTEE